MRAEGADAGGDGAALAGLKAARVRDPDAVVIGADQILVCEGDWFDKPPDLTPPAPSLPTARADA